MAGQKLSKNIDPYEADPTSYYLGYRDADLKKPFAKYFDFQVGPISNEVEKGIVSSPWATGLGKNTHLTSQPIWYINAYIGYEASEAHDYLLRPGYLPVENGYLKTPQGAWMVACRTDMGQGQPGNLQGLKTIRNRD